MNDILVWIMAILSITLVFVIVTAVYFRYQNKKFKSKFKANQKIRKLPFKVDDLIDGLGGVENIISSKVNLSRVAIKLKNSDLIDPGYLKALTAKGIVKNSSGVILIFGNISYSVAYHLNNIKKQK